MMGYRVRNFAFLFTMYWGLHQGVLAQIHPCYHSRKLSKLINGDDEVMFYCNANNHALRYSNELKIFLLVDNLLCASEKCIF